MPDPKQQAASEMQAYERAARAIIEYSQGAFIANEVHDIAAILAEFFPAPAPTPTPQPTRSVELIGDYFHFGPAQPTPSDNEIPPCQK